MDTVREPPKQTRGGDDRTGESERFGASEYLGYRLLVGLERARNTLISRSLFHKLCCLADRRLQSEFGHDIGFPRYWYIYGEVVDEPSLARGFYNAPAAEFWPGQRYHPADGVSELDFAVDERERAHIDEAVDWVVRRFGRWNAERVEQYQYAEHVPNRFIATYYELRDQFERVDLTEQYTLGDFKALSHSRHEFIEEALDRMVETYPAEDYPEMADPFRRWNGTIRRHLEGDPDYRAIEELLNSFVRTLCRVELRFHHRQHIPDERIREWERDRLDAIDEFEKQLRSKRVAPPRA